MMATWEKWSLHLLTVGVSLSGLVFYWMKYLLESEDPFAVLNHPWQADTLNLHLILSPALVFVMGSVTRSHVARKLQKKSRPARRSGLLTLFSFPVMVLSGYLPQVVSQRTVLEGLLWIHLLSGLVFFGTYAAHFVAGRLPGLVKKRGRRLSSRTSAPTRSPRSRRFPLLIHSLVERCGPRR